MGSVVRFCLVGLLVVTLAGCHWTTGPSDELQASHPQSVQLPPSDLRPPGEVLARLPDRAVSAVQLYRNGGGFEPGQKQGVSALGEVSLWFPGWTAEHPEFEQVAFAVYSFNLPGYSGDQSLQLEWEEPKPAAENCWIGFSQWLDDCWNWLPVPEDGLLDPGGAGLDEYTMAGTGEMLVAVVLLGSSPAQLNGLFIGSGASGDWNMYGHNPQHTKRSEFVGAQTNNLKWYFEVDPSIGDSVSSPAIGVDGTIYVGCEDGKLYAVNPDGTKKWSFTTGMMVLSSPAIGTDGTVYVGSHAEALYAVNPDGTEKWAFYTWGFVESSPVIGEGGTIYVGCDSGRLYAVSPDGTEKWDYLLGGGAESSPAISHSGGAIYIGCDNGELYVISTDGDLIRSYVTGDYVTSSPAIGATGMVYVGSWDDELYACSPKGTVEWSFGTGGNVESSPAIAEDGTVYFGSSDNRLYAINPDGTEEWSFPTTMPVQSSPAIGADGTVYVGCNDGTFYAIDQDGELKWSYATSTSVGFSSPAIAADGTVYVGNTDGMLYAFGPST